MQLLTKENRKALPALYSQETNPDPMVPVKFFLGGWTWYATEFDGEDTFFGYVVGMEKELGYFSLAELSTVTGPLGLKVERDRYWDSTTRLSQVKSGERT